MAAIVRAALTWSWMLWACACVSPPGPAGPIEPPVLPEGQSRLLFPARANDQIDVLLVIDSTPSMRPHQPVVDRFLARLVTELRNRGACTGFPSEYPFDYRIAVTSSDLGCGGPEVRPALRSGCAGRSLDTGQPFVANDKRLLRPEEEVLDDLRCLASVGTGACPIAQPLEAARRVLREEGGTFLRPDAYLAVFFVTAGPDCSWREPVSGSPETLAAHCYVDGQDCVAQQPFVDLSEMDGGAPATTSVYHPAARCRGQGGGGWLEPVESYARFFAEEVKGPDGQYRVRLAALMAPPDYGLAPPPPLGPGPQDAEISFVWQSQRPTGSTGRSVISPSPSCAAPGGASAAPSPRLFELLQRLPGADRSYCEPGRTGFSCPAHGSLCEGELEAVFSPLHPSVIYDCWGRCVEIAGDDSPEDDCLLDEVGPDGLTLIRGSIPPSEGWRLVPRSPQCPGGPEQAELVIEPRLRASFAIASSVALTCVSPGAGSR